MFKYYYFLLLAVIVSSCNHNTLELQKSGIETPQSWHSLAKNKSPNNPVSLARHKDVEIDQLWWQNFDDPVLNTLIQEALNNNKTLQIAKERITEAQAGRLLAQSSLLPQINGTANSKRQNLGFLTREKTINFSQADIQASWEVDVFGRNQAKKAHASAILQSTEASQQAVRVGLLAEVARTYFDMHNYQNQIRITEKNLAIQKKTLVLVQSQKQGGLASDFDIERTKAQLSLTEAQIPTLKMAYNATLNRMNVLLGYPPNHNDDFLKKPMTLKPLNQNILIAAPAKTLQTRPDIRVAEREFVASIASTKAAHASVFPNISLTALFGVQETTQFSSTPWNVGAGLVQPILNFGAIQSQIDSANSRQKQAFLNYQQSVLLAIEDMENALSSYLYETKRNTSLTTAMHHTHKEATLAKTYYEAGYTGLLEVLKADKNLLDTELAVTTSEIALRKNLINIYTAAGGGWQDKNKQ